MERSECLSRTGLDHVLISPLGDLGSSHLASSACKHGSSASLICLSAWKDFSLCLSRKRWHGDCRGGTASSPYRFAQEENGSLDENARCLHLACSLLEAWRHDGHGARRHGRWMYGVVLSDVVRISDLLVMNVAPPCQADGCLCLRIDSPSSLHGMQGRQPEGRGRGASTPF